MIWSSLFFSVFRFLIPPFLIANCWLYFYPFLHLCEFPEAKAAEAACIIPGQEKPGVPAEVAPFRLLVFADPQLEGDTSLPDPNAPWFPSLGALTSSVRDGGLLALPRGLQTTITGFVKRDVPLILYGIRKRIDLWGNDYYLAHVYRNVHWWTNPTHTAVLGDLLGSQWIGDAEFKRRSDRFWKKVFKGATKVPHNVTDVSGRIEVLGEDASWKRRLITVAGNHDIGYAGDITQARIDRFEETFGSVNWEIRFRLDGGEDQGRKSRLSSLLSSGSLFADTPPEIRLVVLNSMNLDGGATDKVQQQKSRDFVSENFHTVKGDTSKNTATVLLTHIPLHKEAGICTDPPYFNMFPTADGDVVREQNHLSEQSSDLILDGLASEKKKGNAIVLTGHDHEGCDVYHYRHRRSAATTTATTEPDRRIWAAEKFNEAEAKALVEDDGVRGVREVTVRSMMGSFNGNAGFLSAWFDREAGEWRFKYHSCSFFVHHLWWAVHVFDAIWLGLGAAGVAALMWEIKVELARMKEEERAEMAEMAEKKNS